MTAPLTTPTPAPMSAPAPGCPTALPTTAPVPAPIPPPISAPFSRVLRGSEHPATSATATTITAILFMISGPSCPSGRFLRARSPVSAHRRQPCSWHGRAERCSSSWAPRAPVSGTRSAFSMVFFVMTAWGGDRCTGGAKREGAQRRRVRARRRSAPLIRRAALAQVVRPTTQRLHGRKPSEIAVSRWSSSRTGPANIWKVKKTVEIPKSMTLSCAPG